MYKYGKSSLRNIETTHEILQELANRVLSRSKHDICVLKTGGLRTAEEQNELFKAGSSNCDGYDKISYHQKTNRGKGLAIDLVPYIGGATWKNKEAFLHIAEIVLEEIEIICTKGYYLHWGGFWGSKDLDGDGILELTDRLGWDLPHWELRTYEQTRGVYPIEQQ